MPEEGRLGVRGQAVLHRGVRQPLQTDQPQERGVGAQERIRAVTNLTGTLDYVHTAGPNAQVGFFKNSFYCHFWKQSDVLEVETNLNI